MVIIRSCKEHRTRVWHRVAPILLCALSTICNGGPVTLRDVTKETGITFIHTDGGSGKYYAVEPLSAGLALFDYDNDGNIDIYFLNGAPLRGTKVDVIPKNALYRNEGNWKFSNVTDKAGVGDTGFGLGVAVGDYDNDGDSDIYLNNWGPNILYRNNGDGTFTDVTKKAGVACGSKMGAGACFLDMDKDGDLDLYVSNYFDFSYEKHSDHTINGTPIYVGPGFYPDLPDVLYRNNGNGTFTDVTEVSGIAGNIGPAMGMVCGDYDNDGDTDIFVLNDMKGNFLFQNDGTGKFEDVGLMAGIAYNLNGEEHGSMGADCGDYDNDGWLDFHETSYQTQWATLYKNLGNGMLEDVTPVTGAGTGTLPFVTWGNSFVDFDNDGFRDIFIACGHIQVNIERYDDTSSYLTPNIVLMNTGDGKFVDISDKSGDGLKAKLSSRGSGCGDLDNDGDMDVVILNSRAEPTILRNESLSKGHWIQVLLRGTKSNRDGVGAHVKVVAGDLTLLDEVHSGRGYQSHYGMRLHFGLGNRDKIDRIEVRWIGTQTDVFRNITVDRLITLTEGSTKVE
ncbi:MAG: CRTAC1 family protein [Planctomycetota bacterium]